MKNIIIALFFLCLVFPVAFAQTQSEDSSILYITRYQSALDKSYVYGIFDLGLKPSVRLVFPSSNGGVIRFNLHGRHYLTPVAKSFDFSATFEDVTGRVFEQSPVYTFNTATQKSGAIWFTDLDGVVGMYGSVIVNIKVPAGTIIVNILGDGGPTSASPNQLLGYISHVQLFPNP